MLRPTGPSDGTIGILNLFDSSISLNPVIVIEQGFIWRGHGDANFEEIWVDEHGDGNDDGPEDGVIGRINLN